MYQVFLSKHIELTAAGGGGDTYDIQIEADDVFRDVVVIVGSAADITAATATLLKNGKPGAVTNLAGERIVEVPVASTLPPRRFTTGKAVHFDGSLKEFPGVAGSFEYAVRLTNTDAAPLILTVAVIGFVRRM